MFRAIETSINSFPFIVDLSTYKPIIWNSGRMAEYLASSMGVQVNSRGLHIIHPYFTIKTHSSTDTEMVETNRVVRGNTSLCVWDSANANDHIHVFPTDQAYVSLGVPDVCLSERNTHRVLRLEGSSNDISLCDILSGFKNVMFTTDGRLQLHTSAIGPVLQTCLSVLAIFIMVCVIQRFSYDKTKTMFTGSMACMLASVLVILLVCLTHNPLHVYSTEEDFLVFIYLLSYAIFNLCRWSRRVYEEPDRPAPYSVCLASLNLLANRLFGTTDNPCTPIINVFIFIRLLHKVKTQSYNRRILNFIDLYLDAILVAILTKYGLFPQYVCDRKAAIHFACIVSVVVILTK
jgi:hypothetical protein